MTWLVSEAIDREMYRLSRAICEGNTGEAARRHREICKLYADAPRPAVPRSTEKVRQAAASEARREMGRVANANHLRILVESGMVEFTPTTASEMMNCTRKLAADRLRKWADRGIMKFIGYGDERYHQGRYQLTEKGKHQ